MDNLIYKQSLVNKEFRISVWGINIKKLLNVYNNKDLNYLKFNSNLNY